MKNYFLNCWNIISKWLVAIFFINKKIAKIRLICQISKSMCRNFGQEILFFSFEEFYFQCMLNLLNLYFILFSTKRSEKHKEKWKQKTTINMRGERTLRDRQSHSHVKSDEWKGKATIKQALITQRCYYFTLLVSSLFKVPCEFEKIGHCHFMFCRFMDLPFWGFAVLCICLFEVLTFYGFAVFRFSHFVSCHYVVCRFCVCVCPFFKREWNLIDVIVEELANNFIFEKNVGIISKGATWKRLQNLVYNQKRLQW